jgi:hypothetical protein
VNSFRRSAPRWIVVAVVAAVTALLPGMVAALRSADVQISPQQLLTKVRVSAGVPFSGYAESTARLGFPDLTRAGRVPELLGERTRMRVWWESEYAWRVDELSLIGERGTYRSGAGVWLWDSERRSATLVKGVPVVRFPRASDLLPSELGRRVAAAARPEEAASIPDRSVAGIDAAGLRLTPATEETTIDHVDMWIDPDSGLPLDVRITTRDPQLEVISSAFLDISMGAPASQVVRFEPPEDADFNFATAPDFAQAVDRFSPFVLPESVASRPLRTTVAGAAGTYGDGFSVVGALALSERYSPFESDELAALATVSGAWGTAQVITTPLFTGLTFEQSGVRYVLGGTVPLRVLKDAASELSRTQLRVRN